MDGGGGVTRSQRLRLDASANRRLNGRRYETGLTLKYLASSVVWYSVKTDRERNSANEACATHF